MPTRVTSGMWSSSSRSLHDMGCDFESTTLPPLCFDAVLQISESPTAQLSNTLDICPWAWLGHAQCYFVHIPPVVCQACRYVYFGVAFRCLPGCSCRKGWQCYLELLACILPGLGLITFCTSR